MVELAVILSSIKDYLSQQPDIVLAYLYGSYAEGRAFAWSDLDIGLLLGDDRPPAARLAQLLQHQANLERLLNLGEEITLDLRALNGGSPEYLLNVIRANRCLYARAEQPRVAFEEKVILKYLSFKPILDLYYQEMLKRGQHGQVSHRYAQHLTEARAAIGRA